jgi:hypothetical protein
VASCPVGTNTALPRKETDRVLFRHRFAPEALRDLRHGRQWSREVLGAGATTEAGRRRVFGRRKRSWVVVESGCQTAWAARLIQAMGYEVVIVNPRRVRLIAESTLKADRFDAEILAWLGRQEESLLRPVYQRSQGAMDLCFECAQAWFGLGLP